MTPRRAAFAIAVRACGKVWLAASTSPDVNAVRTRFMYVRIVERYRRLRARRLGRWRLRFSADLWFATCTSGRVRENPQPHRAEFVSGGFGAGTGPCQASDGRSPCGSVSASRPSFWISSTLVWPLLGPGCVFVPPPALPEEIAAQEAEVEAAKVADATKSPESETDEDAPKTFAAGEPPDIGMSKAEMVAYAKAQGDPAEGHISLEDALDGLEGEGRLSAVFETTAGTMRCRLFEDLVPGTVANFVGLARGRRPAQSPETGTWETSAYYDGTEFHRVIEGFMIQGGDPTGTGMGGTGYVIPDEFVPSLRHDRAGLLSMANRGPGTGSGQFFVTLAPTPHLDDKHAIFGECDRASIEIAEKIAATRGPGDRPTTPQRIESVTIVRGDDASPASTASE